jgi:hypothetical protein
MHKVYFFKKRKIMTKAKRKGRKEGKKTNGCWSVCCLDCKLVIRSKDSWEGGAAGPGGTASGAKRFKV